jgi:hypothetical protein
MNIFVKPRAGGRVRMPERQSQVMSASGAWVPRDHYYERLLIAGDVVEAKPPTKAIARKQSAPAKESAGKDTQAGPT